MKEVIERGAGSLFTHVFIPDSTSTGGAGKTGLTYNSASLKIVVIRPGEASATKYLQSAGNIEDITTLGTYAAPTASKCRFKELDATDLPGWYEIQFADALFNTTNSRRSLGGMISGATGVAPTPFQIQLSDPTRGVGSPTALPNAAAEAAGGLYTRGAGAGQINQANNGEIDVNATRWGGTAVGSANVRANLTQVLGTAPTESAAGRLAAAFTTFLDVAAPTLSTASLNQTGDSYARLGAPAGASVSADIAAAKAVVDTIAARLTAARAGYLDNLNVGGVVASQADINALNQSASRRVILTTVPQYERPESATSSYTIEARTYDGDGAAVNADSTPTLTPTGIVSGDLSANLSAATNPATGLYRWTYTVTSSATSEQIRFDVSATLSASVFPLSVYSQVVNLVSATWTNTDASNLTALFNNYTAARAAKLDNLDATISSRPAGTDYSGARAAKLDFLDAAISSRPAGTDYTSGRAAKLDFLDASVASRSSQLSVDVVDDFVDTEVAAILTAVNLIKAKTDQLAFTNANKVDSALVAAADLVAAVANKLADHVHRRQNGNIEASADGDAITFRSSYGLAAKQTHKATTLETADKLTVYKSDDITILARQSLTKDAAAVPITGADTD